jgi:hypothetical protein
MSVTAEGAGLGHKSSASWLWQRLLRGRWRPKDAKRDEEEHEALVQAELAKLST